MKSFHNDQAIKDKYVNRVIHHQKLDNLVKGATGNNGKGCAVACTLDMVYDHSRYPIELGIPEWLARVEDTLFEGMSLEKSKTWPELFLKAIPLGIDCEKAKTPFIIVVLESTLQSMASCEYNETDNPNVKSAIDGSMKVVEQMIFAQKSGDVKLIEAAASAAWSVRSAAASAAESAAASAAESAAESARSAAWSARSAAASAAESARSARSAAWSARSAAASARSAAWSARSAAASAAESAAFDYFADELLEILSSFEAGE